MHTFICSSSSSQDAELAARILLDQGQVGQQYNTIITEQWGQGRNAEQHGFKQR